MRSVKLFVVLAVLLLVLPAFADTWTVFPTPTSGVYLASTTNFGGGDGSGGSITSLGPFSFMDFFGNSTPMIELSVPGTWALPWGCPPTTESCTPNVLFGSGQFAISIPVSGKYNTVGFELEPDTFEVADLIVQWTSSTGSIFSRDLHVNGSVGALLFAVQDDSPGAFINNVSITNPDEFPSFAMAQLRAGNSPVVPEPGTLALFGSGALGLLGLIRRKHVL